MGYIYIFFDGIFFTRTTGHRVFPNHSSFSLFHQYLGSLPYSCLNLGFFQSVLVFVAMVPYFTWKVPSPSVMFFSCREVIFLIVSSLLIARDSVQVKCRKGMLSDLWMCPRAHRRTQGQLGCAKRTRKQMQSGVSPAVCLSCTSIHSACVQLSSHLNSLMEARSPYCPRFISVCTCIL